MIEFLEFPVTITLEEFLKVCTNSFDFEDTNFIYGKITLKEIFKAC